MTSCCPRWLGGRVDSEPHRRIANEDESHQEGGGQALSEGGEGGCSEGETAQEGGGQALSEGGEGAGQGHQGSQESSQGCARAVVQETEKGSEGNLGATPPAATFGDIGGLPALHVGQETMT